MTSKDVEALIDLLSFLWDALKHLYNCFQRLGTCS